MKHSSNLTQNKKIRMYYEFNCIPNPTYPNSNCQNTSNNRSIRPMDCLKITQSLKSLVLERTMNF